MSVDGGRPEVAFRGRQDRKPDIASAEELGESIVYRFSFAVRSQRAMLELLLQCVFSGGTCKAMPSLSRDKGTKEQFDPGALLVKSGVGITLEKFQKNQQIYVQGGPAGTVAYLRKGRVKATVLSDHGKEAIVGVYQEDQFFGVACLGGARLRMSTAVALEDCLITFITKKAMLSMLDSNHDFSAFFMTRLVSRIARLEEDLTDQLLNSSEKRLARILLVLANRGRKGEQPVALDFSQGTLAEMVGTTRSRVSTFMNQFRKKGFIRYDSHSGKIEVYTALLITVLGG
jgi:CRP/FNR family transcriptional regulator, cyclic AMP receptor protein